jgi:CubicO group peptidase (beta-lactamase class C family)
MRTFRVACAVIALVLSTSACTTYRIVRWQTPSPDIHQRAFPERIVTRAEHPFDFITGAHRVDLDTIAVRDVDGTMRPFAEYLARRRILALLIVRGDTILYERYAGGYTPETRATVFSVAKSAFSPLVAQALESGAIESLDDEVVRYLPEFAGNRHFQGVTVRHLLTMRSGFAYSGMTGHPLRDLRSDDARFFYTNDMRRLLRSMRRASEPGERYAYKDSDTELLAWVLSRATGETVAAQFERQIWRRIGAEHDASWSLDRPGGVERVASGFNATTRDLARFARLYLHGGAWNGEQIVPAGWVEASVTLDPSRTQPEVRTWWGMQHNHLWWVPMHDWAAHRDFYADGHGGQRLYVHPPSGTIIVQIADDSRQDFPFRRLALYLHGGEYQYPRITGVAGE